ncbi:MAG: glycosyltransferase family 39 protein [Actinomycetes bacterium]
MTTEPTERAESSPGAVATEAAAGAGSGPRNPLGRSNRWLVRAWIPIVLALLAVAARVYSIQISGGFWGYLNPDEGAYFGSSFALINGVLPYRDIVLLHPPGVSLAYAPAAATSWLIGEPNAFAAVRLMVVLVGAANTVLAYNIANRVGRTAAVAAGLMYALWFPAVRTERTTLLEPLVNLALLGSLALLNDKRLTTRRLILAGVVGGLGISVKLWALAPVAVLCVWLLTKGWRKALLYSAGVVGGTAAVLLPFLVVAPTSLVRMTVLDQLGRSGNGSVTITERLAAMLNASEATSTFQRLAVVLWLAIAIAAVLVALKSSRARPWVAMLAVNVGILLVAPTFFLNYTAFVAVPLVLTIGACAQLVADRLCRFAPVALRVGAAVCIVLAMTTLLVLNRGLWRPAGESFPVRAATAAVAQGQCVTSDSATAIILTGHFSSNVEHGCPVVADFTGRVYETRGLPLARLRNPEFQAYALEYLLQGDYVIIMRAKTDDLSAQSTQTIAKRPVVFTSKYVVIYGPPTAP